MFVIGLAGDPDARYTNDDSENVFSEVVFLLMARRTVPKTVQLHIGEPSPVELVQISGYISYCLYIIWGIIHQHAATHTNNKKM